MRKKRPSSGILLILALIMSVSNISKEIRDLGIISNGVK